MQFSTLYAIFKEHSQKFKPYQTNKHLKYHKTCDIYIYISDVKTSLFTFYKLKTHSHIAPKI